MKPLEVEQNNSTVYLRKNITQVTETDVITKEKIKLWQYDEKEMTVDEYYQYQLIQESTNTIMNYQKQDTIDEYTEQLIEEGVL